jgi:hypothetical protein
MIDRRSAREDAAAPKQPDGMRDEMTTHHASDLAAASWITRLAIGIALTIGLIFAAIVANAEPLTTHPRMWITSANLPKLRGWAVNTNPMYKNGLAVAAHRRGQRRRQDGQGDGRLLAQVG